MFMRRVWEWLTRELCRWTMQAKIPPHLLDCWLREHALALNAKLTEQPSLRSKRKAVAALVDPLAKKSIEHSKAACQHRFKLACRSEDLLQELVTCRSTWLAFHEELIASLRTQRHKLCASLDAKYRAAIGEARAT
jgi:hypothetical protein